MNSDVTATGSAQENLEPIAISLGVNSIVGWNSAYAENLVQSAYRTHADLERLKLKNNGIYEKFIAFVGCDLVRKLKHRNDKHVDLITKLDFVV